jgi:hypothetical protein
MDAGRLVVKIVVAVGYAITEDRRPRVKIVVAVDCVFTTRSSTDALNANGLKGGLIYSV